MAKLRNAYKLLDPEIRAKNLRALRYSLRGVYFEMRRPEMLDPVFIVGCSRSGTTVTYETIASSRRFVSVGYELLEFWDNLWGPKKNGWHSEAAEASDADPSHRHAAQKFFFEKLGRGRVLDKTCINVMRIPYLYRLFPNATFVFVYRDGRDNISSLIDGWRDGRFALSQFLGPFPSSVRIDEGRFREWHFFLPPGWGDYNRASLEEVCAYQWVTANSMAMSAREKIPSERWIELRYEDLVATPEPAFSRVFDQLGIEFGPELRARCRGLASRPTSLVTGPPATEKWKQRNPAEIRRIMSQIEPMLRKLGYQV